MYGVFVTTASSHEIWPCPGNNYGHPVNTANFFLPIGDRINRVPLYINSTKIYTKTCNAHIDSE